MAVPALVWTHARFEALSLQALYDALQLRSRVFILEQGPYLDPDGLDQVSAHLFGRDPADGALRAYLRIVDPGHRFDEPSIGRVITAPEVRGQGLGLELMRRGIAVSQAAWPGLGIRISAQARLERFYAGLGFQAVGEPYDEDGIPHLEMLRAADVPREPR